MLKENQKERPKIILGIVIAVVAAFVLLWLLNGKSLDVFYFFSTAKGSDIVLLFAFLLYAIGVALIFTKPKIAGKKLDRNKRKSYIMLMSFVFVIVAFLATFFL